MYACLLQNWRYYEYTKVKVYIVFIFFEKKIKQKFVLI